MRRPCHPWNEAMFWEQLRDHTEKIPDCELACTMLKDWPDAAEPGLYGHQPRPQLEFQLPNFAEREDLDILTRRALQQSICEKTKELINLSATEKDNIGQICAMFLR